MSDAPVKETIQIVVDTAGGVQSVRKLGAEFKTTGRAADELQKGIRHSMALAREGARTEAQNMMKALEQQFRTDQARIREGLSRGFINREQARQAGREAAIAYNQGLTSIIDRTSRTPGAFSGAKGSEVYLQLAESFKTVDLAGKRSTITLNSLRASMTTVAASALNTIPGVTQLSSAVGAFALGTGMMIAVMAGIAAVVMGYRKITEEAREAKKAAQESGDAIVKAFLDAQTQGDITLINQQGDVGLQLDFKREQIRRAEAAKENKEFLKKLNDEAMVLQKQYDQATTLLDKRRADRRTTEEKRAADAAKNANDQRLRDLQQFIQEYTDDYKRFHDGLIEIESIVPVRRAPTATEARFNSARGVFMANPDLLSMADQGFDTKALERLHTASDKGAKALETLSGKVDEATEAFGRVPIGPNGDVVTNPDAPGGRGVMGWLGNKLNPEQILSNIAGNILTGGVNAILSSVGGFVDGLFDFSGKAKEAERQMAEARRALTESLEETAASLRGDIPDALLQARMQLQDQLRDWDSTNDIKGFGSFDIMQISKLGSFDEMIARLEGIKAVTKPTGEALGQLELMIEILKLQAEAAAEAAAEASRAFSDDMAVRRAQLNGNEEEIIRAQHAARAREELANAQKMLDAGTITQEMFDELTRILNDELNAALEDVAIAALEAAKALLEAQQSLKDSLTLAEFEQAGDDQAAAEFRARQRAQDWIEQAMDAGFSADDSIFARIQKWLDTELANIAAGASAAGTPSAAVAAAEDPTREAVTRSVTSVTQTTALTLVDIDRTIAGHTSYIPKMYDLMQRGGGGFGAGGGGVTLDMRGAQINAITPQNARQWVDMMIPHIVTALGKKTQTQALLGGSSSN